MADILAGREVTVEAIVDNLPQKEENYNTSQDIYDLKFSSRGQNMFSIFYKGKTTCNAFWKGFCEE